MNQIVKEFIEDNIIALENEDYRSAFFSWYLHYVPDKSKDYINLQELFHVFSNIGIDLYNDSAEARKSIIADEMYAYIDGVFTDDPDCMNISLTEAANHLNSKLDVRLVEINELFKVVGEQLKGLHDLLVVPFNIRRKPRG